MSLLRPILTGVVLLASGGIAAGESVGCAPSANSDMRVSMRDELFAKVKHAWPIDGPLRARYRVRIALCTVQRPVCYRSPPCEQQSRLAELH